MIPCKGGQDHSDDSFGLTRPLNILGSVCAGAAGRTLNNYKNWRTAELPQHLQQTCRNVWPWFCLSQSSFTVITNHLRPPIIPAFNRFQQGSRVKLAWYLFTTGPHSLVRLMGWYFSPSRAHGWTREQIRKVCDTDGKEKPQNDIWNKHSLTKKKGSQRPQLHISAGGKKGRMSAKSRRDCAHPAHHEAWSSFSWVLTTSSGHCPRGLKDIKTLGGLELSGALRAVDMLSGGVFTIAL